MLMERSVSYCSAAPLALAKLFGCSIALNIALLPVPLKALGLSCTLAA